MDTLERGRDHFLHTYVPCSWIQQDWDNIILGIRSFIFFGTLKKTETCQMIANSHKGIKVAMVPTKQTNLNS